ncbi:MAG: selenocysteine-specific translation elongation factor [Chloroflexi bacterium]|nr:selenocysteine-specific translation elongation factor [Chloroflexota bacterium]
MYVIGTAGHVDHGKSTLVQALTGIDPDRLEEEKRRGMTIDLGFAWLTLPSGREVSIVDVPGHERFIKNMLAGVGGIDLALLVVAADESVMPQTREHLAILDLLGVSHGLVVITKKDLVDDDLLGLVQLEVEDVLKGTTLEGSAVLSVSATTGDGLPELLTAIDGALDSTEQRRDLGRPRLPVDRSFTITGFGTVVTGTLVDGSLQVGQEVEIVPSGRRSRVRGLQSHRKKLEAAAPGSRVAVNLTGIASDEVVRGEVVTTPGWLRATHAVDARLLLLHDAPHGIKHNYPLTFHAFAAETPAKVRLLDRDLLEPGGEAWAQIWLEHPVALARGDRFVVRSPDATLGGGTVVEVDAKRHRRNHAPTIERLERLSLGSPTAQLLTALESREPADARSLAQRANVSEEEAVALARQAVEEGSVIALDDELGPATQLYTTAGWNRLSAKAQQALGAYHEQHPLRLGMTREELRSRLGLKGAVAQLVLSALASGGAVVDESGTLRLPEHEVGVSAEQQRRMDDYVAALAAEPFRTEQPSVPPELLALLVDQQRVVRATDTVAFDAEIYDGLRKRITDHLREHGKVTVAEVRDMFGTSRKYALAVLEHLDEEHVTRRVGDERVLLQG